MMRQVKQEQAATALRWLMALDVSNGDLRR